MEKDNLTKRIVIAGDRIDFLDKQGTNITYVDTLGDKKAIEIDKVKITKTFKLVNPVPKF